MRFSNIDKGLQNRVLAARKYWESVRVQEGYAFEDSWVGSKLAGYLHAAGFENVQEKSYRIMRSYSLPEDFRFYLQGIAEWFVCEGAPFLDGDDMREWLRCFLDESHNVLDQETFLSEETEFVVTAHWRNRPTVSLRYFDMQPLAIS